MVIRSGEPRRIPRACSPQQARIGGRAVMQAAPSPSRHQPVATPALRMTSTANVETRTMPQEGTQFLELKLHRFRDECFNREPQKWLFRFSHAGRAERVLDIGCGLGYNSMAWARAGKEPVGVDFVFDLVKNATELARLQSLRIAF